MSSHSVKALLSAFALFIPLAVSPVPFVEGSLDTTMDNKEPPTINGDLPLASVAPDMGV